VRALLSVLVFVFGVAGCSEEHRINVQSAGKSGFLPRTGVIHIVNHPHRLQGVFVRPSLFEGEPKNIHLAIKFLFGCYEDIQASPIPGPQRELLNPLRVHRLIPALVTDSPSNVEFTTFDIRVGSTNVFDLYMHTPVPRSIEQFNASDDHLGTELSYQSLIRNIGLRLDGAKRSLEQKSLPYHRAYLQSAYQHEQPSKNRQLSLYTEIFFGVCIVGAAIGGCYLYDNGWRLWATTIFVLCSCLLLSVFTETAFCDPLFWRAEWRSLAGSSQDACRCDWSQNND